MAAGGHFGCPKITFDLISGHYRSIHNFNFFFKFLTKLLPSAILDVRNSLRITFLAILDQYRFLIFFDFFFYKMAAGGHFGCPKFTFDRISGHFISIGHFGFPKFTFDRNSGHFRSIQNFFFRRPYWMSENHFGSHFWPFQIDRPILDVRNSLSMAFLAISDPYRTFFFCFFLTKWPLPAILDVRK